MGQVLHGSATTTARLLARAKTVTSTAFLSELVEAVPYRIHIVLTDTGIQFADLPKNRSGLTARWREHPFDRTCLRHDIEYRLTRPNHPWTHGQVERMNRILKEATVKRYHYETHEQLTEPLQTFMDAYNYAKRLKTLKRLKPFEYLSKCGTDEPERFKIEPYHHMPGPNT